MKIRTANSTTVVAAVAALLLTFVLSAGSANAASSAILCEGTIEGASPSSGIPNGHFFSTGVGTVDSKSSTKDCEVSEGSSVETIDGSCVIDGKTLDPCVISGNVTTIIALSTNCSPVATGEGIAQSTPGLAIVLTTSGPFEGCGVGLEVFPFNRLTAGYWVGVSAAVQIPGAAATCPVAGAGGIARCTTFSQ